MGSRIDALTSFFKIFATGVALSLGAGAASAAPVCSNGAVQLRGDFGEAQFNIDVAATQAERSKGLMYVKSMPSSYGMLFVFDRPRKVSFWMKNTLIPLDMIFVDAQGVVQNVHVNAVPGDLTPIHGQGQIKYVLEINGGLAPQLGIGPGTQLRHPAIDGAAWPC